MAAQVVVCVLMILLTFKGCHSQQPVCGRLVNNSTITGGQNTSPRSWPWQAAIEYVGNVICQGSLISDQWVLTAASCVSDPTVILEVHLGVRDPSSEEIRQIQAIVCNDNIENNICLLQLSSPVNFTDYIQPVCLASENSTFYSGTTSWVTGLEITQIVGNKECRCDVIDFLDITGNEICAGSLSGFNNNDDGAALVTKNDSIWVQSGILIQGPGYPSVYTRVSQFQKWISDRVTGMEPGFVTFTSTGTDSDLNYTCPACPVAVCGPNQPAHYPSTPPTTPYPSTPPYPPTTTYPPTTPYPPPTTPHPPNPPTTPYPTSDGPFFTTPPTTIPVVTRDCGIFCSSGNSIPIPYFLSLFALLLSLHAFVESIF